MQNPIKHEIEVAKAAPTEAYFGTKNINSSKKEIAKLTNKEKQKIRVFL